MRRELHRAERAGDQQRKDQSVVRGEDAEGAAEVEMAEPDPIGSAKLIKQESGDQES